MRILKQKVALAMESFHKRSLSASSSVLAVKVAPLKASAPATKPDPQPKKRNRALGAPVTSEKDRATKNIVKNYGKAICSFACSELATPYLSPMLKEQGVQLKKFIEFIMKAKDGIESILSFRNYLLVTEEDSEDTAKFKKVFSQISEVFIKYFSVNWIFSGRLTYKESHLKFRFKLLRRIKNPEAFITLKFKHTNY